MPINYGETTKIHHEMISFVCDCCQKEYDDILDMQEMMYYHHECGFGSNFGDGAVIEVVLCEKCTMDKLGDFIRVNDKYVS